MANPRSPDVKAFQKEDKDINSWYDLFNVAATQRQDIVVPNADSNLHDIYKASASNYLIRIFDNLQSTSKNPANRFPLTIDKFFVEKYVPDMTALFNVNDLKNTNIPSNDTVQWEIKEKEIANNHREEWQNAAMKIADKFEAELRASDFFKHMPEAAKDTHFINLLKGGLVFKLVSVTTFKLTKDVGNEVDRLTKERSELRDNINKLNNQKKLTSKDKLTLKDLTSQKIAKDAEIKNARDRYDMTIDKSKHVGNALNKEVLQLFRQKTEQVQSTATVMGALHPEWTPAQHKKSVDGQNKALFNSIQIGSQRSADLVSSQTRRANDKQPEPINVQENKTTAPKTNSRIIIGHGRK